MADTTVRNNGDRAERNFWQIYVIPALLGALATLFFFHYVPEVISLLHDDLGLKIALKRGFTNTYKPFIELMTSTQKSNPAILAWPIVGAIGGFFVFRISTKG